MEKSKWQKPVLQKLSLSQTKGGTFSGLSESAYVTYGDGTVEYGDVS